MTSSCLFLDGDGESCLLCLCACSAPANTYHQRIHWISRNEYHLRKGWRHSDIVRQRPSMKPTELSKVVRHATGCRLRWPTAAGLWAKRIYPIRKDGNLLLCSSESLNLPVNKGTSKEGSTHPAIITNACIVSSHRCYFLQLFFQTPRHAKLPVNILNSMGIDENTPVYASCILPEAGTLVLAVSCDISRAPACAVWDRPLLQNHPHSIPVSFYKVQCCWATWWWTPILLSSWLNFGVERLKLSKETDCSGSSGPSLRDFGVCDVESWEDWTGPVFPGMEFKLFGIVTCLHWTTLADHQVVAWLPFCALDVYCQYPHHCDLRRDSATVNLLPAWPKDRICTGSFCAAAFLFRWGWKAELMGFTTVTILWELLWVLHRRWCAVGKWLWATPCARDSENQYHGAWFN